MSCGPYGGHISIMCQPLSQVQSQLNKFTILVILPDSRMTHLAIYTTWGKESTQTSLEEIEDKGKGNKD